MGACPNHSGAFLHVERRGRRPAQDAPRARTHPRVRRLDYVREEERRHADGTIQVTPKGDVDSDWTTLTGTSIMSERTDRSCVLDAPVDVTEKRMRIRDFKGIFVYHSPQYPGYTCF